MKFIWRKYLRKPLALLMAAVLTFSAMPLQALSIGTVAQLAEEDNLISCGSFDADLSG